MSQLTPEERQRIYEEEKARIEARQSLQKNASPMSCCCAGAFLIVFFFFILSVIGHNTPSTSSGDSYRPSSSDAEIMAQQFVKERLKAPGSADFSPSSETTIQYLGNDTYKVYGWVDSQNSFGAKLRSRWTVKLRYVGANNWQSELIDVQ